MLVVPYTNLMDKKELHRALDIARNAVVEAGIKLKPYYGNIESTSKGDRDGVGGIVTRLDVETEQFLAEALSKFSADVGFRGEELGTQSEADLTWLVDPIDGTAHFIRGLPFCTTMVSLIEKNVVVLAIIHNFITDETFWAIRGEGAYCNDTPISVSSRNLKQAILSYETHIEKPGNCEKYVQVTKRANIISTLGSGHEFSMIASGKIEGKISVEPYGMDWDFAPGSLLVTEAGGIACNIGKTSYDYRDHDFIISNKMVYEELTGGNSPIFPIL